MTVTPRPATTLLLLRGGTTDLEVFMVQRHRRSGFLPNAWVFPGGRVDDGDRLDRHPAVRGGDAVCDRMGLPRASGLPFLVAGVRETFEEAGIWLGEGRLPDSARAPLARREVDLATLLTQYDATLDLDRLVPWSWWVTPEAEPKRYDTRFLAVSAEVEIGSHDDTETVASAWIRPRDVLPEATLASFPLAPPTWWTLRELSAHGSALDALKAAARRPRAPIQPVMKFRPEGLDLLFPGHPEHPHPRVPGLCTRIQFDRGRWVASDGDGGMPLPY